MTSKRWGHKLDYFVVVTGSSIGVGTVWKFPYMVARNGGGIFILLYLMFMLIGSLPITCLETFIGQYSQKGPFEAWKICPALQGLALGNILVSWVFGIYYPVFFSWLLYYLYHCFSSVLPWTKCGQSWNSDKCREDGPVYSAMANESLSTANASSLGNASGFTQLTFVPPAEEFFRNNVLQITDGLQDLGHLRWPLTLCLTAVFLFVFVCMVKGIRITGKLVYATVGVPFGIVTVILIRATMLPGSREGILYYITPDFGKLKDPKVWVESCSFALYGIGASFGLLIKLSSHNDITRNVFRDSLILNIATFASNVYFGFSVFAMTGHLAFNRGVGMDTYDSSGFKLGFITYPEASSFLPLPQLWSVFLFLMFFTLGIDSLIPIFEVVSNYFEEIFHRWSKRKWLIRLGIILTSLCMSIPFTLQGGVYLLTLVEWFAFFPSLALFALIEVAIGGWIYGTDRINKILTSVCGNGLPKVIEILWKYITPALLLVVLGYSVHAYRPPRFEEFIYPDWANVIGWILSLAIVSPVPIIFLWNMWKQRSTPCKERLRKLITPTGPWEQFDATADVQVTMCTSRTAITTVDLSKEMHILQPLKKELHTEQELQTGLHSVSPLVDTSAL